MGNEKMNLNAPDNRREFARLIQDIDQGIHCDYLINCKHVKKPHYPI